MPVCRWTVVARLVRTTTVTAPGSTSADPSRKCLCRGRAASVPFTRQPSATDAATLFHCCLVHRNLATRTAVSWTPFCFLTTINQVVRFGHRFLHRVNLMLNVKAIVVSKMSHCAGTVTVQMRKDESESGIRKWEDMWFKTTTDGERGGAAVTGVSQFSSRYIPQTSPPGQFPRRTFPPPMLKVSR